MVFLLKCSLIIHLLTIIVEKHFSFLSFDLKYRRSSIFEWSVFLFMETLYEHTLFVEQKVYVKVRIAYLTLIRCHHNIRLHGDSWQIFILIFFDSAFDADHDVLCHSSSSNSWADFSYLLKSPFFGFFDVDVIYLIDTFDYVEKKWYAWSRRSYTT